MTSPERQLALYQAVQYIVHNNIPGDFVECGIWRGGSSMLMAHTLLKLHSTERKLYLYDTFAGMSEPTEEDVNFRGDLSIDKWKKMQKDHGNDWDYSSLEEVQRNMSSVEYPPDNVIFVKGKVEDTIPSQCPNKIALLRLDTDWYDSTKHELQELYPRLQIGGILIIDDYGHWRGARKAVDEYFKENGVTMFLNRIDYTGRLGVKVDDRNHSIDS